MDGASLNLGYGSDYRTVCCLKLIQLCTKRVNFTVCKEKVLSGLVPLHQIKLSTQTTLPCKSGQSQADHGCSIPHLRRSAVFPHPPTAFHRLLGFRAFCTLPPPLTAMPRLLPSKPAKWHVYSTPRSSLNSQCSESLCCQGRAPLSTRSLVSCDYSDFCFLVSTLSGCSLTLLHALGSK